MRFGACVALRGTWVGGVVVVGVVLDDEVVVGLELDGGHGEEEE